MFLESITFYERVEVLLKFKFLIIITNVFEELCGNPALDHDSQGMFDIALFLKKTTK